jgi:hypothetical protein
VVGDVNEKRAGETGIKVNFGRGWVDNWAKRGCFAEVMRRVGEEMRNFGVRKELEGEDEGNKEEM